MFTELLDRLQLGKNFAEHSRTHRLNKSAGLWYFHTREGIEVGPFMERADARYALFYFTEKAEWPDKEQLLEFKSGCEMNAGIKQ